MLYRGRNTRTTSTENHTFLEECLESRSKPGSGRRNGGRTHTYIVRALCAAGLVSFSPGRWGRSFSETSKLQSGLPYAVTSAEHRSSSESFVRARLQQLSTRVLLHSSKGLLVPVLAESHNNSRTIPRHDAPTQDAECNILKKGCGGNRPTSCSDNKLQQSRRHAPHHYSVQRKDERCRSENTSSTPELRRWVSETSRLQHAQKPAEKIEPPRHEQCTT